MHPTVYVVNGEAMDTTRKALVLVYGRAGRRMTACRKAPLLREWGQGRG